jgi:hypothetical protein
MKKQKEFVKMKVYEDRTIYNQAVKESEKKINVVKKALEWSAKHIDTDKIDRKKFLFDMVGEFNRQVMLQKRNITKVELAVEKIHFLLDIHITELQAIQREFDRIDSKIYVEGDDFVSGVSLEDFTRYTSTEEENERLIVANDFIYSIEKVMQYNKCYPIDLTRGSSSFIKYDFRTNKYIPNI